MSFKRFDQNRPFVTLGILVLGWLLIPVAVKSFGRASFFELTAPISVVNSYVRGTQEYWNLRTRSKDELIAAGAEQARIFSAYEFAVQQNTEQQAQIARLEELLRLPSFANYRYEHARIVRRDFSGWWQRIVIRKGKNFNIPLDAPVVFTGGVVGKVVEVGLTTAVVDLVSSPTFRATGVVEGDTKVLSYQGGINATLAPPTGVIDHVSLDIKFTPSAAKRVVTSGLGGLFPPGLTLGTISNLRLKEDGLAQQGEVRLDERLGSLTEVTVLVPLESE